MLYYSLYSLVTFLSQSSSTNFPCVHESELVLITYLERCSLIAGSLPINGLPRQPRLNVIYNFQKRIQQIVRPPREPSVRELQSYQCHQPINPHHHHHPARPQCGHVESQCSVFAAKGRTGGLGISCIRYDLHFCITS